LRVKLAQRLPVLLLVLALTAILATGAALGAGAILVKVNGQEVDFDQPPLLKNGRVLIPLRAVAESLGAEVEWDQVTGTAVISTADSSSYLRGLNHPGSSQPGILANLITARELLNLLDDDGDGDVADYRGGHNGGDALFNDPLLVDVRTLSEWESGHIPTAIFIAPAEEMTTPQSITALRQALERHVSGGGAAEIVVVDSTGQTSGLVCGLLGGMYQFKCKTLQFGFGIAWEGNKRVEGAVRAIKEDKSGRVLQCGG